MKKMTNNVIYIPKEFTEVNGATSNRSVRAKQEAIVNPLNAKYVEATQVNSVVNEQPKVEEAKTPVEAPPAAEQPIAPDISINNYSIEKPAPAPIIAEVETPINDSVAPPIDIKPAMEVPTSIPIPEPVATVEETFVPPVAEVPKEEVVPSIPSIDPIQNNGFGVPTPVVNDIPTLKIEEEVQNISTVDTDVKKVFDEVIAKLETIDEKDREISELKSKVSTYETAFKTIKSTLSSQQLEEPGEVYKKAA